MLQDLPEIRDLAPAQRLTIYGEVFSLLARNPIHRAYSVDDFENRVLYPLGLGQGRIYRKPEGPVALLTWAFFSDDLDKRMHREVFDVQPEDWNSGDHLWYMDFVAPFGDGGFVINDMLSNVFPDRVGKSQRAIPASEKPFVVRTYYGVNVPWRKQADG